MPERLRKLDRLLEAGFRLHPGEMWPTLLMFTMSLATVGAFIVGRSVRDTLFLAGVPVSQLPYMYVWASLAVATAGALYARIATRVRIDRLVIGTSLLFAATVVAARLALPLGGLVFHVLYVWVEVAGSIAVLQFWTFSNEVYDSREARRLFGLIGAGGMLANVVVGFAVSGLARRVGAENLLYLCAALFAASAALVPLLSRAIGARSPAHPARGAPPAPGRPVAARLWSSAHLRTVAAIVILTFLTTTLVDYQFKTQAAATFGQARDAMAGFFGTFFGVSGIAAVAVQLAVTTRLLEKLGVVGSLAVLPMALGLSSSAVMLAPALLTVTLAKGSENVFRYTVNEATTQILYLPLPSRQRRQAKALIEGVLRPGAIAAAGLALALFRPAGGSVVPFAAAAVCGALLWLVALLRLRVDYVQALRQNLKRRLVEFSGAPGLPPGAGDLLRRALASPLPGEVESALELGRTLPEDLSAEVGPLLSHASPRVRHLACEYLARSGDLRAAAGILRCFEDPDPEVRASAIRTYCAIARDKAVRNVRPFLAASEPPVRAAAVAGMIRHGGLDGILVAAEPLKQLLASPEPAQRLQAARVLAVINVRSFYQPVLDLLADPDLSVRRAAIDAAGVMRSPELVPALVYRLARRETARAAAEALAEHGPGIERLVAKVLSQPGEDPEIRRNAPRVLGRLATPEAVRLLTEFLDDPDPALRRNADMALARAVRARPELAVDEVRVRGACLQEMGRAYRALAAAQALRLPDDPFPRRVIPAPAGRLPRGREGAAALLGSALRERVDRGAERVCLLVGVVHPGAELDLVQANLRDASPGRRANALEILDNVLDKSVKRRLVPLLDDRPREARLREGVSYYSLPRLDATGWIAQLLGDANPWVTAAAAWHCGESGMAPLGPRLVELLGHRVAFVREAALMALERLLPGPGVADAARRLATDPFEPLRARAQALVEAGPRTASA